MKVGFFLVNEKGVGDPDEFYVFCAHHQLFQARPSFKRQPWVLPKLSGVKVIKDFFFAPAPWSNRLECVCPASLSLKIRPEPT